MCFESVVGGSFLEDIWGLARSQGHRVTEGREGGCGRANEEELEQILCPIFTMEESNRGGLAGKCESISSLARR